MTHTPMQGVPTIEDLRAAHERILPYTHRTPVLTSLFIDETSGAEVFLKCENFQRIGAFKFRGACNALFSMQDDELANGVTAHSSGNHGQALALAARLRGTHATIVMPSNSSNVKLDAVRGYGAEIVLCEPTTESRHSESARIVAETGAALIHPFNDPRIVCGQGTAARELLEEVSDLDVILAPVGGGGLLSGTILAARERGAAIDVVGAEPAAADDAYRSLETGTLQPMIDPHTIADGLRTSLGPLTFAMIQTGAHGIVTVSEEQIIDAMRTIWMRMKVVIEPSAAVPVAAVLNHKLDRAAKRIGIIVSGGNVDLDALPWVS